MTKNNEVEEPSKTRGRPKKRFKKVKISISIDPAMYYKIQKIGEAMNQKVSQVIEGIIGRAMDSSPIDQDYKGQKLDTTFAIKINSRLLQHMKVIAEGQNMSLSELSRQAIVNNVREHVMAKEIEDIYNRMKTLSDSFDESGIGKPETQQEREKFISDFIEITAKYKNARQETAHIAKQYIDAHENLKKMWDEIDSKSAKSLGLKTMGEFIARKKVEAEEKENKAN